MAYGHQNEAKKRTGLNPSSRLHTLALVAPAVFAADVLAQRVPSPPVLSRLGGLVHRRSFKAQVFGADRAAPPPKELFLLFSRWSVPTLPRSRTCVTAPIIASQ